MFEVRFGSNYQDGMIVSRVASIDEAHLAIAQDMKEKELSSEEKLKGIYFAQNLQEIAEIVNMKGE